MKKFLLVMICASHCLYGSAVPQKIEKVCSSAEKTLFSAVLQGFAKALDASNSDKLIGQAVVVLAAVGAAYIFSRPYAWMNARTEKAEHKAEMAEKEAELYKQAVETYELLLQNDRLTRELEKKSAQYDFSNDRTHWAEKENDSLKKRIAALKITVDSLRQRLADIHAVQAAEESGTLLRENLTAFYVATAPQPFTSKQFEHTASELSLITHDDKEEVQLSEKAALMNNVHREQLMPG